MNPNHSLRLAQTLQQMFMVQARDVMSRIDLDSDRLPDMTGWIKATAEASQPLLLQQWQQGMVLAAVRIASKLGQRAPVDARTGLRTYRPGNDAIFGVAAKGWRREKYDSETYIYYGVGDLKVETTLYDGKWRWSVWRGENELDNGKTATGQQRDAADAGKQAAERRMREEKTWYDTQKGARDYKKPEAGTQAPLWKAPVVLKSLRRVVAKAADVTLDFDLFNPRVLDAVNQAAFAFCRETMDTATSDLKTALDDLRKLMRGGLSKGDAVQLLARKVREVFADPARAFRIATTESSRAMHGGALMAAKESGVVKKKEWLASFDACKLCRSIDGKQVALDKPFYVDPKGGPYASVWYPPMHPHSSMHV